MNQPDSGYKPVHTSDYNPGKGTTLDVAETLIQEMSDLDHRRAALKSIGMAPDLFQCVQTFHRVYGMPIVPPSEARDDFSHIAKERLAMRFGLIEEEFKELCEAMDIKVELKYSYMNEDEDWVQAENLVDAIENTENRDLPDVADACIDLCYVTAGFMFEVGAHPHAVLQEVQASNMTKLMPDGSVLRREDGKVLKGPNYIKADITRAMQGRGMICGSLGRLSTKPDEE